MTQSEVLKELGKIGAARTVLSTVGPVEITRAYIVNGDGERSFPLDDAMGLVGGCTPAAGLACWAGAQSASYDLAGAALARLAGLAVPGRRVQRLVNLCAEEASAWAAKRQREDYAGGTLNIQADMTGIPMRKEDLVSNPAQVGRGRWTRRFSFLKLIYDLDSGPLQTRAARLIRASIAAACLSAGVWFIMALLFSARSLV